MYSETVTIRLIYSVMATFEQVSIKRNSQQKGSPWPPNFWPPELSDQWRMWKCSTTITLPQSCYIFAY